MNTSTHRRGGYRISFKTILSIVLGLGLLAALGVGQDRAASNQRRTSDQRTAPQPQPVTRSSPFRTQTILQSPTLQSTEPAKSRTRVETSDHSSQGVTVAVEFGDLEWDTLAQRNRQVRKPIVDGTQSLLEAGAPDLPVLMKLFQLPKGQARVQVVEIEEEPIAVGEMARVPEDAKLDYQGSLRIPNRPDIDNRNALYPQQWVTVEEAGMWRGHRLAAIKMFPLRVNPVTGQGIWVKRAVVRISFEGARPNPIDNRPLSQTEQAYLQSMLGEFGGVIFAREQERHPPVTPDFLPGVMQFKIYVSREGLYKITYQNLVAAGVPALSIQPRFLRLRNKGLEIPIYVAGEADGQFNPQDYIEFYGIPNRETFIDQYFGDMYMDPFSNINVYWLSWDNSGTPQGLRLIEESCPIIVELDPTGITPRHEPRNFLSEIHRESDLDFERLSAAELETLQDHWFMDDGIDGREARSYFVELPDPDSSAIDSAQLKIALTGLTFGDYRYHHAQVWLNNVSQALNVGGSGTPEDPWNWYNQNPIVVDTRDVSHGGIPQRALRDGTNTVTIQCMGDTPGGPNDTILPNWFEITYPRLFKAHINELLFNAPASIPSGYVGHLSPEGYPVDTLYHFNIENFASDDISIYKLGSSVITNYRLNYIENHGYVVEFQDFITEPVEYFALTQSRKLTPDSIRQCTTTGRLTTTEGANYLVISHPMFLSNALLGTLISRRSLEYTAMLISTEEIYDEFNEGILSPYAIKDFLSYAYYNWITPPEMVLLVGDLVYDIKNLTGYGGNWMPSMYLNGHQSGWYPSDFDYTLVSGNDLIPDLDIGRIPCRNHTELNNAINKIIHYEDDSYYGPWRNSFLFISSLTSGVNNFIYATLQILAALPEHLWTQFLEQDPGRVYSGGTNQLLNYFNQQRYANIATIYNGHGAGGTWAGELWRTQNVASMNNAYNLPFISNFTCYICAFDGREAPGDEELLGEKFLQNGSNQSSGAIGVYGSVSLGWFQTGINYQQVLLPIMGQTPGLRLGDIVNQSKGNFSIIYTGPIPTTTLHQMVLFGDPAVRLKTAQSITGNSWSPDPFINPGETDTMKVPAPFPVADADFRMFTHYSYSGGPSWGPYPTKLDSPQTGFWNRHLDFEDPLSVDTIDVSVHFPDSTFTFLNHLGYTTASNGSIRGYLYNEASARDAVTNSTFYRENAYTSSVQISNLSTSPDTLYSNGTFRIIARIFAGPNVELHQTWANYTIRNALDSLIAQGTVPMVPHSSLQPFYMRSASMLGPFQGSYDGVLSFQVGALYGDSTQVLSNTMSKSIYDHRANLSILGVNPTLSGTRVVTVIDTIRNTGISTIPAALVRYVFIDTMTALQTTWEDTIRNIPGNSKIPISFAMIFPSRFHEGRIFLDPDSLVEESVKWDNFTFFGLQVDHFQVTRNRGSILPGVSGTSAISYDNNRFSIRIPSGGIAQDSAVLVIHKIDSVSIATQGGLDYLPNWRRGYQVLFGDSSITLRRPTEPSSSTWVRMDTLTVSSADTDRVTLYRQPPQNNYWTQLLTDSLVIHHEDTLTHTTAMSVIGNPEALGTFAVMKNTDNCVVNCGPKIDISVEGQLFGEGSYVPTHPKITAYIQDYNGIDLGLGKFWVACGDRYSSAPDTLVPAEEIAWTDTFDIGGSVGVSISPGFTEGEHWVSFYATDNNGNHTYRRVDFVVANQFSILYVGNYPNPFKQRTIITYTLTDNATERVRIRIYTVSGRLIRTLYDASPNPINYREIIWDGRDGNGEVVANGVYFARLRAVKTEQVIEETLKIAKIR